MQTLVSTQASLLQLSESFLQLDFLLFCVLALELWVADIKRQNDMVLVICRC